MTPTNKPAKLQVFRSGTKPGDSSAAEVEASEFKYVETSGQHEASTITIDWLIGRRVMAAIGGGFNHDIIFSIVEGPTRFVGCRLLDAGDGSRPCVIGFIKTEPA